MSQPQAPPPPNLGGGNVVTPDEAVRLYQKVHNRFVAMQTGGQQPDCSAQLQAMKDIHEFFDQNNRTRAAQKLPLIEYLRPRELKPEEQSAVDWARTLGDNGF
jgi:hypothetical protein